jgi:tetratricopeptide (TPR) repeat protein
VQAGSTVAGRFRIEVFAGRGGMATVYRAVDLQDGSSVALKQVQVREPRDAERFMREAQLLQKLAHPGLVGYRAHGMAQDGSWFLAMDWVEGKNLADHLQQTPLTLAESLALGIRVADVLVAVHAAGVVHRDIKPSNILVPGADVAQARVVDFGVAHLSRTLFGTSGLTGTGAVIGTPGYLSPEQVQAERVDGRSDLFALGCVLFECLVGRAAFEAPNLLALLARITLAPVEPLRSLRPEAPPELERLVAALLEKAPAERPRNALEVLATLRSIASLPLERQSSLPAAPRGVTPDEQRLISVVAATIVAERAPLANIVGDATLHNPAAVEQRFQALATEHGARLEVFPGALVAVMESAVGTPGERTLRAARLALALQPELAGGTVVVATGRGVVSRASPVGQVIDRAVAELEHAPPGIVLLDETSASMLGTRFELESRAGKTLLISDRAQRSPARPVLGKETPFVGRRREANLLALTHEECVGESSSRALLVTGEPGLGKSRLCHEFLRELDAGGYGAPLLVARGDPMRVGSAHAMLAGALREAAGVRDDDLPVLKQQKLLRRVGEVLQGAAHTRVAAFLGELAGVPFAVEDEPSLRAARLEPSLMSEQIRSAFSEWLGAECARRPALIVLEDLHWGDLSSLQLVDAALDTLEKCPLMVLALARLEVHEQFPKLRDARRFSELSLSKLSSKASGELVQAVLGDVAPERRERLVERAGGNPFFLEELVRAAAAGVEQLPETVLGMLESRIAGLPPEARLVLRAASVFGEVFWKDGVNRLLNDEALARDLQGWLVALKSQELLVAQGTSRFAGHEQYAFRHALLRDASYATLTAHDRALAHRLAGAWLEHAGEGDAVLLAEHYERGEAGDKAATLYLRACIEALQGNDLAGAVRHGDKGLALTQDARVRGEILLHKGEAYTWRGEPALARDASLAAIELLPRGSAEWCTAIANLGDAAMVLGTWDGAEDWVDALASLSSSEAAVEVSRLTALGRVSFSLALLGESARAERALTGVSEGATRGGAPAGGARALTVVTEGASRVGEQTPLMVAHMQNALAARAIMSRNREAAAQHYEQAAAAFESIGAMRLASGTLNNVGAMYVELGAYERAVDVLQRALSLADEARSRYAQALARFNLGVALSQTARVAEAMGLERLAIDEFELQSDIRLEAFSRCALSDMLLKAGDVEAAEREARKAVFAARNHQTARASALAMLAHLLLVCRRPGEALPVAREGMAILSEGPLEERESLLRVSYAEALRSTGEVEQAREVISAALTQLRAELDQIDDPALKESFCRVDEHARTFALAKALAG